MLSNIKGTNIVKKKRNEISSTLIQAVCERISRNERVRRTLPDNGRLHVDRQVPFLCVYRQPPESHDPGTEKLVKGEASYLVAPGSQELHEGVSNLVEKIVETLSAEFGATLIVEVWSGTDGGKSNDAAMPSVLPKFSIFGPETAKMTSTVDALAKHLKRIKVLKQRVKVTIDREGLTHAPGMPPLIGKSRAKELNCSFIGIEVPPVFRTAKPVQEFPILIGSLRRSLSLAMRQAYFEFARARTTHSPPHFHAMGRKAVVKAVWEIDRQLGAVSNQFDYLLQLTPVNTNRARKQFEESNFEEVPEFHYRPLPVDPAVLKRELFKIPIERVEDPALQRLFEEKREELELKITMLRDRDTPRFLLESLTLFGGVKDPMLATARDLLERLREEKSDSGREPIVGADEFAKQARDECDYYRESCSDFKAKIVVTDKVSGLIVSRGKLLVNSGLRLSPTRVRALLAHEVGTHLVTYYNGRMQPFHQLYSGLAGYEELQEGLAVLSEYLVGGLSASRMRQLAARVVAVQQMSNGADFIETFRTLHVEHGLTTNSAFSVTMRVFRSGGLTKDAIYLRGLVAILKYVRTGGALDPLLIGKIALKHLPIVNELQHRGFLKPAPIIPRYIRDPHSAERLAALSDTKTTLTDLVATPAPAKTSD